MHSLRHMTYVSYFGQNLLTCTCLIRDFNCNYYSMVDEIRRVFGTLATSKNGVYQFFEKRRNFHNSRPFVFFGLKWINKKHLTLFKSNEILRLISLTRQFQVRTENAILQFYYEGSRVPRKNPKLMRTVLDYDAAEAEISDHLLRK